MKRFGMFMSTFLAAASGCRVLETGYGDDNVVVRTSAMAGLPIDMRRAAEGRRAGWLRDLFDD